MRSGFGRIGELATVVYILCALAGLLAAALVLRAFLETRQRLLFWAGVCFAGLAANNIILFVDKVIAPDVDLSFWRSLPALLGLAALLYGLIWETSE
jgi:hypothetical protein